MIRTGSDFSGVGAFDQALNRLGIEQKKVYACDMDKYARQSYIHNYGEPMFYPENVYDRAIPTESLDIYMTSPPCQAFSLAGKRKGETDKRGVLFYNSHEFIQVNKPRYFIFENVKGLLSDDGGKTFQRWLDMLGGKSVNGNPVIFPHEESTPYHVYHQVLNAKNYGIPQNRERVFIIGIRDDADNNFSFPRPFPLEKRLRDVLEDNVDEKYYLSDKMLEGITYSQKSSGEIANLNKGGERGSVYSEKAEVMSCLSATDYKQPKQIQVKSDGIIQLNNPKHSNDRIYSDMGCSPTLNTMQGGNRQPFVEVKSANKNGTSNTITSVQKDNLVIQLNNPKHSQQRIYDTKGISPTIMSGNNGRGQSPCKHLTNDYRIRRLTPRECFRLMDFPDSYEIVVSDTQAYKQAGNSICVGVLVAILGKLNK
jgi:DNA (cytosine-5)-methyltransferase 1